MGEGLTPVHTHTHTHTQRHPLPSLPLSTTPHPPPEPGPSGSLAVTGPATIAVRVMPLPAGPPLPRTPAGGWGRARARAEAPGVLPSPPPAAQRPFSSLRPLPLRPQPPLPHSLLPGPHHFPKAGDAMRAALPAPHLGHTSLHHPTLTGHCVCGGVCVVGCRHPGEKPARPCSATRLGSLAACGGGERAVRQESGKQIVPVLVAEGTHK